MTPPFAYPTLPHVRRHGPRGYADYPSFRPWLRDEFTFRCAYCLRREQWGLVRGTFAVDHFLPVAVRPDLATEYDNLVYACAACNTAKSDHELPNPAEVFLRDDVRVAEDGTIEGDTPEARRLIRVLGLDDPEYTEFRLLWIGIIVLASQHDRELFVRLMSFPADLPDLGALKPPDGNTRPNGVTASYFEQRSRGELPETY
jgi:hypothetical protein